MPEITSERKPSPGVNLVQSRLQPPIVTNQVIRRALKKQLHDCQQTRLTIIQAPAGYGKTSLLIQWYHELEQSDGFAAWLTTDMVQKDSYAFLFYVLTALEKVGFSLGKEIHHLISQESIVKEDVLTALLANRINEQDKPVYLFIDDFHLLSDGDATKILFNLIDYATEKFHIILSTRESLSQPVARLRASGQLTEVDATQLRMNMAEVTELLALSEDCQLNEQEVKLLADKTEGWPAGLKLASLALRYNEDREKILHTFTGERTDIWDFFAEDVLETQPEEIQEFLLKISVLDKFCTELCEFISGDPQSAQHIQTCIRSGLFVTPLDDTRNWYRIHNLFRDFLLRNLSQNNPQQRQQLHMLASDWLQKQGYIAKAFEHAMSANNPVHAAKILNDGCDSLFSDGQPRLIRQLADQLPAHVQALYPRLMLGAAWSLIINWRFDEASALLSVSESRIKELKNTYTKEQTNSLYYLLRHRKIMFAQMREDTESILTLSEDLLQQAQSVHPFVTGSTYTALINAQRLQYKLKDIEHLDHQARQYLSRGDSQQIFILHEVVIGHTKKLQGQLHAAENHFRRAVEITTQLTGHGSPIGSSGALGLAEILFEKNQLQEAEKIIEDYLPVADKVGSQDQLISGWTTHVRRLRRKGKSQDALKAVDDGLVIAQRTSFTRLRYALLIEKTKMFLQAGKPDDVVKTCRALGLKISAKTATPTGQANQLAEALGQLYIHQAIAKNELSDALGVAKQWSQFFTGINLTYPAIRWHLIFANLYFLNGEHNSAQRMLRVALTLAAEEQCFGPFLDEKSLMNSLFQQSNSELDNSPAYGFSQEIIAQLNIKKIQHVAITNTEDPIKIGGALNNKELEILRLAGDGLLNREIGNLLGMTEGSVKWYFQQIFDKLGVRRRAHALERAALAGLIEKH